MREAMGKLVRKKPNVSVPANPRVDELEVLLRIHEQRKLR